MELAAKFKDALCNKANVQLIINNIGIYDISLLMMKYNGLTKPEVDEIKTITRDGKDRLQLILTKLIEKNTLDGYMAFSKVLEFKNSVIHQKVFPFVKSGDHDKLHLGGRAPQRGGGSVISPTAPVILWLCENHDIFKLAHDVASVPDVAPILATPSGTFKYCKLPENGTNISVWLFHPTDKYDISKLLNYYEKSQYFIFTGIIDPRINPCVHGGSSDICVLRSVKHPWMVEELCHTTTLWTENQPQKSVYPWCHSKVNFVSIDGVASSIITNSNGLNFSQRCNGPHAVILTENELKCPDCNESSVEHAVQYSYEVIKYLSQKEMLFKCFGRTKM